MEKIQNDKTAEEEDVVKPARKRARWGLRFSLGFALTTVILALLCWWLWKTNSMQEQRLSRVVTRLGDAQAAVQQEQTAMRAMTRVMSAPDTGHVGLTHQTGTPPGNGQVFYNARMGIVVYTGTIAPAPSDKTCHE